MARTNTPAMPGMGAWNQELDNYRLSFVSYDDNGNIKTLRRRGLLQNSSRWQGKQYGPVDDLTYTYQGNRLLAVDDQVTGNQLVRPASYHGAPTSLAGDFQERGVRLGQEYFYDASGNMTQDKNKGITGITYNFLDQPKQIHFGTGADSIVFRYTGTGLKIAKLVYQTGKPVQRTDYLGPYQYEGDSLRFFPHAGGRVLRRVAKNPAGQATVFYQREYTFSDHLGNLRLAYRGGEVRTYSATLEQDAATHQREKQQFDSLSVSEPIASPTWLARTGKYAAQLNAGTAKPQPLGPLMQLAVQKGDTLNVTAYGLYPQAQQQSFWFSFVSFLTSLVGQQPPAPAGGDPGRGRGNLPLLQIGITTGLPALQQLGGGVPKGYLRVLVFDKDSVLVNQYTQQLTSTAFNRYEPLQVQLILPQDGYVTTYVGNESNVDVFFDDIQVEHRRGLQVQEMHYDPYGLSLAGLSQSSPGLRPLNKFTFNGVEFGDDLGLGLHLTLFRLYDPQLGRFHQVDPLADFNPDFSPFNFGDGNPVTNSDAEGLAANGPGPLLAAWRAVKDATMQAIGFTKKGHWNGKSVGGKGNVSYHFLGHTHHKESGRQGIKPMKPNVTTLDAPPLDAPVPDMNFVTTTAPPPSINPIIIEPTIKIPVKRHKINPIEFHEEPITDDAGKPRKFNAAISFGRGTTNLDINGSNVVYDLANFLKDRGKLSVVITVNTADISPVPGRVYGPATSPAVLNQPMGVNGVSSLEKDLLLGRAQAIVKALNASGINSSRITIKYGGHWDTVRRRAATLQFKGK